MCMYVGMRGVACIELQECSCHTCSWLHTCRRRLCIQPFPRCLVSCILKSTMTSSSPHPLSSDVWQLIALQNAHYPTLLKRQHPQRLDPMHSLWITASGKPAAGKPAKP